MKSIKALKTKKLIYSLCGEDKVLAETAFYIYEMFLLTYRNRLLAMKDDYDHAGGNISLFLSYDDIKEWIEIYPNNKLINENHVFDSIKLLCNPSVRVLVLKYIYIDDSDEEFDLTAQDVQEAYEHDSLIHPLNGLEIKDYKKHVFTFFAPSEVLNRNFKEEILCLE